MQRVGSAAPVLSLSLSAFALGLFGPRLASQVAWERAVPEGRFGLALACDALRQRVVLFGGAGDFGAPDSTAQFDGRQWRVPELTPNPGARWDHAMAYDPVRRVIVLTAGHYGYNPFADTWEWDGRQWTDRQAQSPSVNGHAMAAQGNGEILVFGGTRNTGPAPYPPNNQTWTWNGASWRQLFPVAAPAPRSHHVMVHDPVRGRIVLFGGYDASFNPSDETWEWDGSQWLQQSPATRPTPRAWCCAAFDVARSRVVLFGGHDNSGLLGDTWEWDGATWTLVPTSVAPTPRYMAAMCYDPSRGRCVLLGGADAFLYSFADHWEWDGTTWSERQHFREGRRWSAMEHDPVGGGLLLFGGVYGSVISGETARLQNDEWQTLQPPVSPAPRHQHGMATDSARQRIVLFGGRGASGLLGDTWEWDGGQWLQRQPPQSPGPRAHARLAYDPTRQRMVLFGGSNPAYLAETWEYDGTTWQRMQPVTSPGARVVHGLAFDPVRGRVLLFGGMNALGMLGDTWEWDGMHWTQLQPGVAPQARGEAAMALDPALGRVVLYGGTLTSGAHLADTWEWTGASWYQRPLTSNPGASFSQVLAFDPSVQGLLLFAGTGQLQGAGAATWELATADPATYEPFGSGCPGAAGAPALAAVLGSRPWLGETLRLSVANASFAPAFLLLLGLSRSGWGGVRLPLDLTAVGMPGCNLLVSGEMLLGVVGGSTAEVAICACPELLGLTFYNQILVPDAAANALGATVSNGAAGRIGAR